MDVLLAGLGLENVHELGGGYQSRGLFTARLNGDLVVAKLIGARDVDRCLLETRLDLLRLLGSRHHAVCVPVVVAGRLVNEVGLDESDPVLAVAYEFAHGRTASMIEPSDAALMGRVLADLHAALAGLPAFELPDLSPFPPRARLNDVVDALGIPPSRLPDLTCHDGLGRRQLLHGDFNSMNVLIGPGGVRVVDFDDCGYGPVEFDVALALYMVLVSATTRSQPADYESFRQSFLDGYCGRSGVQLSEATLDMLITYRVVVFAAWLSDAGMGPPAVRTWPGPWRATLRRFISGYRKAAF